MNFFATSVSLFIGISLLLMLMGIKLIKKRNIQVDKFSPNYRNDEPKSSYYEQILKKSKVPIRIALALIMLGGVVVFGFTFLVTGELWISLVAGFAGFLVPNAWYQWHVTSNKKALLKQMEQASEVMASVIKTGSSLPDALERAAQESKEPLKSELVHTATQIRIGVPSSDAFMEMTARVDIGELKVIAIAIELQEQGMAINVPNLFLQLQADLRYKVQFQKEVSTTTSEIKMSGIIVSIVPFVTIAMMRMFNPEFTDPLFNEPIGILSFFTSCILIGIGVKWMFSIANFEETV